MTHHVTTSNPVSFFKAFFSEEPTELSQEAINFYENDWVKMNETSHRLLDIIPNDMVEHVIGIPYVLEKIYSNGSINASLTIRRNPTNSKFELDAGRIFEDSLVAVRVRKVKTNKIHRRVYLYASLSRFFSLFFRSGGKIYRLRYIDLNTYEKLYKNGLKLYAVTVCKDPSVRDYCWMLSTLVPGSPDVQMLPSGSPFSSSKSEGSSF